MSIPGLDVPAMLAGVKERKEATARDLAKREAAREATASAPKRSAPPGVLRQRELEDVDRERSRRRARRTVDAEEAGEAPPFDIGTLADVLARPREDAWRVHGLIPAEGSTLVTAMRKTGKTTLLANLARALLTGEDFLGNFPVTPVSGTVALLNFEVNGAQIARWLHEAGVDDRRCLLVNLRGRRNPFGVEADRDELAKQLKAHEVESLLVDPFGRAFPGESQNDAAEVGRFLTELDRFKADVGANDLVLTNHAGWEGERSRGSSALEDWPDSLIRLVRDAHDEEGRRYISALGRDVEVGEGLLSYDQDTRRLTVAGAGRDVETRRRRTAAVVGPVVELLREQPGLSQNAVATALGQRRQTVVEALAAAVESGTLSVTDGPRGAKLYAVRPPEESTCSDLFPLVPVHVPALAHDLRECAGEAQSEAPESGNRSDLDPGTSREADK